MSPGLSRRAVLAGAALAIPGASLAAPPARLGWRLAPGMVLTWQTTLRRALAGRTSERTERWTYLVRGVDPRHVATLEARPAALGLADPAAWSAEVGALAAAEVRLGLTGELLSCSQPAFARSLPHRLLALRLPDRSVVAGDHWEDLALARSFARLLPVSLDLRVRGTTTLDELDGAGVATLSTRAAVSSDGPTLDLVGWSQWDAVRGVPLRRELTALFSPSDPSGEPGRLDVIHHLIR